MSFSNEFNNDETLLRGIHIRPEFWDYEKKRPTSAAFKSSKGLSVNRTGDNKKYYEESLECLKNNLGKKIKTVAELDVNFCLNLGLYLKYCPVSDNIYHSEIHKSESEPSLSKSVSRKLSEQCRIVNEYV